MQAAPRIRPSLFQYRCLACMAFSLFGHTCSMACMVVSADFHAAKDVTVGQSTSFAAVTVGAAAHCLDTLPYCCCWRCGPLTCYSSCPTLTLFAGFQRSGPVLRYTCEHRTPAGTPFGNAGCGSSDGGDGCVGSCFSCQQFLQGELCWF